MSEWPNDAPDIPSIVGSGRTVGQVGAFRSQGPERYRSDI
jgi:hypothetical protein